MKIKFLPVIIWLAILFFSTSSSFAQLTGTKYIPGDYPTVSSAVNALNVSGPGSGGVTFNIAANYTETITATISLTATGTVANPVIFQKDPATSGSNPVITSYTTGVGTPSTAVQDGIWRLLGSDYVTITGIDLKENPANTTNPSTMEYGYALYKASGSNGCQFVIIKNCTISLSNINNATGGNPMTDGSAGIIVMNATATAANAVLAPIAGGTNSNNIFYSNTIQNCNIGISLIGYSAPSPFTLADTNNDIGGTAIATGNTIINYGGATGATNPAAAIRTLAQYGLNVSYNTINNNNGSGINHPNVLRGIYINAAASAGTSITNNTITLNGGGTTQNVAAIENISGSTAASNTVNISNNTIANSTYATATTGGFYGIFNNSASPAALTINNNIISNNSSLATTTGYFYGIYNSGAATTGTMSGNAFTGNATAALTTGLFTGIYNSAALSNLIITNNTLAGNSTTATSGIYYPIYNSGAVTTTININSNNIGTNLSPAITFNAANSGAHIFINNTAGAAAAALSISNNNFQGINYAVQGSGANTYISNTAVTLSQAINSNTFTGLNVNTTGSITFIANSVVIPSTGTQNINSNSIITSFTKAGAPGTVTLFSSSAASATGSVINNNNNNFSNITVSGATVIAGWMNTDAGSSTKNIQNNTFSNWTAGTGNVTAMSISLTGVNNATSGNSINNISTAGTITAISTAAGNDNIYSNTIYNLVSSGTLLTTVNGISVSAGTTKNIYQNSIYNLKGNTLTTGTIRGIVISAGTTINVYQNTIDSLQGNAITTGSVNGISISGGTTINPYQNTIYSLTGNAITSGTVNGISISGATTVVAHRNKVYDLSSSGSTITTGTVNGFQVSGATASTNTTIRNNLVGDLRTPAASATDPIRGININSSGITSNINIYDNTIYLNGASTGANFGSTGIYHLTNAVATTAKLDLRNNIITNISTPNGTGFTVAYRRSSSALANYATTSNNNLFYSGTSGATRLIYYDITNSDQTLSTFKTRVSPADALSVTEDIITTPKFLSTVGSSSNFLHIDPSKTTQIESGGSNIAGFTNDYDGDTRQGNTGYTGTGTAPDIGADEFEGAKLSGLSGTYNVGTGQQFTSLTNAGGLFATINTLGLAGNVMVNITSDLAEDGTNSLYQWAEQGSGNYTLSILPDGSTTRTVSGNVLAGLIRFTGADRVTIDGSYSGSGSYLTFRNTNTTGTTGTAFTFINGATNNTIKYCNVEAYTNATNGVILFSTSNIAGGNSSNRVSNCNINATVSGNTGILCIYSGGTTGNENSTNTISNNIIYNYRDRGLDIPATGSSAWSVSGNSFYNGDIAGTINYAAASTLHGIRILGGSGYAILNNYIGGNASLAAGTNAVYASTLGIISYQAILLTTTTGTPASAIKGNTIAKISVSAVPTSATAANVFIGIETNGVGVNIGGSAAGEGNTIGSNTINSSIVITTTTSTATFKTNIRGINCASTGGVVIGNQIGGIDIKNIGAAAGPSTFLGIYVNSASAPSQVNNNIVGSTGAGAASNSIRVLAASASALTALTGIAIGSSVVSAIQVNGNIIQNISYQSTVASLTGGGVIGISSAAAGAAIVSITGNTISSNNIVAYTTGIFYGIYNSGPAATLSITSNIINGNSTASASGVYFAIYNAGGVTSAININSNSIGNSTTGAFTFSAANSGAQVFISNIAGAATAVLSISNNNFQGITYSAGGTSSNTYILNAAATLSQAINGNTFTSLSITTTGNITFISNSVIVPATGTQNVNSNSISGTFVKTGIGTVTLFTSSANSISGSIINNNSNNFSNITVGGAAIIAGWVNTDGGASAKTIQNNIFSNWTGGSGTITALTVSLTGANNSTSGNLVNNISSTGPITGITTGTGNDNIYSNIINTLSTTGAFAVSGIVITGGTAKNIYKNKIYDLQANNATGTVNGILVSGTTIVTINIFNNVIGDLRTPIENSATDAIRGVSVIATAVSSTVNVYYNTIYLNATSSGAAFGSSGIYHTTSGTATTAALNLRNNSVTNTSTAKGSGLTVAYRRSNTTLTNYASSSNNNLFYAGVPAAAKLIFSDGTNADQTLAAYKARVSARDAQSVTEDISAKFLSTAGSSSLFLHMDAAQPTNVESGAVNITGFTDDIDGQIRAGNTGYTGTGTSPDIGADEIFGIESVPPTITYTLLTNTTSAINRAVTGVSITDASGINIASGTKPRIYYKRSSDANAWLDNSSSTNGWKYTEATNSVSPFTFTIDYSLLYGGASVTAGVIQYFIVAQDLATTANIAINSGTFTAPPSNVALTSAAFPIGGTINSYNIPFAGIYNVGNSEIFTSLTKADGLFASINTVGLMGNATFNITSDLAEDGTNALNQWVESGAGNYTITIQPDGTTLRTISGNVAAGLIRLSGADRLTIDGSNGGGGNYLSFKNTNTAGTTGTAITFLNGAANNTIRYAALEAYANATNGVVLFSTSAVAGGNSNNLIDNCTINAAPSLNAGNVAIYSGGTPGNENASNIISNSTIYNYRDRGLDIAATGSATWTVSGNSFYNGDVSAAITYASSSALHGMRILGGSGYSILNNYIGGNGPLASGNNASYTSTSGNVSYQGILLTTTSASPLSNIKGNTIAAISVSSVPTSAASVAFTGIETNGAGVNIGGSTAGEGNHIGSAANNGSIIITTSTTSSSNTSLIKGINCASTGGSITGSQVAGFDINNIGTAPAPSSFIGIYINSASAPSQVLNNVIGSNSTSNSIRVLATSSATTTSLAGISIGSSVNSNMLLSGNIIENMSQLSLTSSGNFTGISNSAAAGICTVSNDTIQNITTAANANSGSTSYIGISSGSSSSVTSNVIKNISLSSSGTNAQVTGINVSGAFAHTITGNIISGLSTASSKTSTSVETGSPALSAIIGILNTATITGQVISGNTLYDFNASNNAAVNTVVTGIGITATIPGNIFNNRIAAFTNNSTGSGPGICGITAANGLFNVYNNSIKLDNAPFVNGVKIYGIIHATANNWSYYFNSISIGGNATGTALRSAAFIRPVTGNLLLRDNVFINARTGTGSNYAISNTVAPPNSNWPSTASDYNNLFSSNINTTGEWGLSINKTFAQWQASSGGEGNSFSKPVSFISSLYDLQPDSSSNCTLSNSGTPITTPVVINTDINNISRNAVSPDLGAYEFNYAAFTINAGDSLSVCAGDSITLSVDPGNAISPLFSWSDPANTIISTTRNPTVAPMTGHYKVTVTDLNGCYATDSTLVSINQRPTATIISPTSLCDSGFVNLNISVTGAGTISGVLSNGDNFSGTAPLIVVPVYAATTTSYSIYSLTDSGCTAKPADIPDTVTITVTHKGDWLGITTNWSDPVNWCGGVVPTSATDVTIPTGTLRMPVITDSAYCNNLTIHTGDTLTVAATGTLNIAGLLANYSVYNDNGTTNFNGTSGQQTFSGVTVFNNLALNNSSGLLLPAGITVNKNLSVGAGTLNANNFNITVRGNWTNNFSTNAFTAGTATVTFSGTTPQVIGGAFATAFNNLTTSSAISTVTLGVNANVAGNLSVSAGTLDLAAFTANRSATGGILTVANGAILKIGGTNTFPVNYSTITLVVASTVEYSGTNQTVANKLYGNLVLSSSAGAAVKTFPATALLVAGNLISTLGTGTSVSFTAASDITVSGNVSIGASTAFNGGSYSHAIAGNWVNNGTFNGNTGTVTFTGSGTLVNGTGAQNFNNLTVAASAVTFSSNNIALTGNLATTGSGSFSQASGGTLTMSGTGATISGSGISLDNLTVSGTVTTAVSLNITGNLTVTGSFIAGSNTVTMSGASKTMSGTGYSSFSQLYVTGSVISNADFSISSGLTVSGSFSASAGTAAFTGTSSLSGTANLYNVVINGTSLQLSSGSVLGIANVFTITSGVLDVSTSSPNIVNFNGTAAQNINGITYNNLVLSNGNTKTAAGPLTANDLTIETGTTFNPAGYTHGVYGNWINHGTFAPGTSTIEFLGPANAYILGNTTFNILTINTSSSGTEITLQSNIAASNVNMTRGRILTDLNTLTITNTRTGNGIILGRIQRTHAFTTGVPYAFEGPDNTITFSSVSAVGSVTVSVAQGSISDFPFGGSISRVYDIVVPAGTYNATLRLHYEDNELNGNNESSMALWHYNGSSWSSTGKSGNSTISNYVEQSGLTDITNRWTASDNANLVQWNGSVSSDWNTPGNWTVLQGSGSRPPSSSDIVNLGTITFVNQPTISNAVTVKNIIFGSTKAVTLDIAGGGSLTTSGDINGNWAGNATHTINVNNQSLTINGGLDLSDGTNGHAINLNIGSGSVSILGSLVESGNANINFTGPGSLNIYHNFNYTSGTFTAGGGTVTYNGSENQDVANINYNNLAINKSAGLAAINNTVNIAGNLLISSGELDNFATTTISGNVTINAGDSLRNYDMLHVQGNWNNNGSYTGSGSSIIFDGNGTQTISASTFNNLTINKPVGSIAVLTGNVILNGDLTITSGTLDIKTFDCNRSVQGGTITIADPGTFIVGANNSPLNFSNGALANASTVIANGTGPQSIFGVNFGNLIFRNGGAKTLVSPITVNGDLTIESGSNFDASSNTITLNGNWVNNGTFIPSTSTLVCSGTAKTVSGNTTFNKVTITGSYTNLSNITYNDLLHITSSGSISSGTGIFTILNGDLTNNGVLYTLGTTTFTGNVLQTLSLINAVQTVALIVNFNGSISPVLNSTTAPQYGYLNINNTGGIYPSVGWSIANSLTVGNGASFNGGVSTHNIYGSVTNNGTITSSGVLNFLPASPAIVNLGNNFSSTGRVTFGGAGAMTIAGTPTSFRNVVISNTNGAGITPSSPWNIINNFTVNSGSVFNAGNYSYPVGGRILNNGTINSATSTFILNGAGPQDIYTVSDFNNLTLNKTAGFATLSSNVTVKGVLQFVAGTIQTGSNILSQPASGTLTGAAQNTGWVNGNLQKNIPAGANISGTFEVGDDNYYTPATTLFANVSVSGNLMASAAAGEHPQIDLSGINKDLDVNRYWTLTNSGIGFTSAMATLNWVPSDLDAGVTATNFKTSVYNGSSWAVSSASLLSPTSIQATGLKSFGSFAIGEGFKMVTWTGAAGTADWFTSGNWFGGVPDATVEVVVPEILQAGSVFPVINTGTAKVDSITIENNALLTLNNSTLQVKGAIINNGIFDAGNGTIEETGVAAQTIAANTFYNNALNNLIISNTSGAGVILGGALDIYGSLTYSGSGMTLTTNDYLTLKSTALNTASVGDMTDNTLTGQVTVERYISARKAWRLLSIPTNTTQTIQQAWQEGCGSNLDCAPGYGIQITGPGGIPPGFDLNTPASSIKTYNSIGNNWTNVTNTNSTNIKNTGGYMTFIRGGRTVIDVNSLPTETVLRTKGSLYTGDQTPVPVIAGKFAAIGNPYASSLDMRLITKTGLKDFFYVWDPKLGSGVGFGGYQTFSYDGSDYVITPGQGSYGPAGSKSNLIQSGQAFLVQGTISGGSLTFTEDAKANGSGHVSVARGVSRSRLCTSLYGVNANGSTYMIDGVLNNYDDSYSNSVDDMDAFKSANTSENLAIKTANKLLVIERRQTIIHQDTIFLNITSTKFQQYRFEFAAAQLGQSGLTGFLEDNYLHTSTPLNLDGTTTADFNIVNVPGSYAPDRFRIVFKQPSVLPVTLTNLKAFEKNNGIAVEWKVENENKREQYQIERSVDGNRFTIVNKMAARNSALDIYNWFDADPAEGYNYYRVISVDINGKKQYSAVVKVFIGKDKQSISIYPNPVSNGTINLQLVNQAAGVYGIRLLNNMGQVIISKQINHTQGSSTETIQLDKYSPHGVYQMEVSRPGKTNVNINVIY